METIREFMQEEYLITPAQKSIDTIVKAGFKEIPSRQELSKRQRDRFFKLQMGIHKNDLAGLDDLVAKVFALAYPYEKILNESDASIRNWSHWLGKAEYDLGSNIQLIRNYPESKGILLNKSTEHLLTAREKGDNSPESTKLIIECYAALKQDTKALDFLLEEWNQGNKSQENERLIHSFLNALGQYEEGINFYLKEWELGNNRLNIFDSVIFFYSKLKKYGQAVNWFEENKALVDKIDPETMHLIAQSHYMLTEREKDKLQRYKDESYHESLKSTGRNKEYRDYFRRLGKEKQKELEVNVLKKFEEALGWALKAEELGNKSKENLDLIKLCYFHKGDYEQTLNYTLKAAGLNGNTSINPVN